MVTTILFPTKKLSNTLGGNNTPWAVGTSIQSPELCWCTIMTKQYQHDQGRKRLRSTIIEPKTNATGINIITSALAERA